jgi:hypothetical protein
MLTDEKKKRFAERWLPRLRTELGFADQTPKAPVRKQRFHLDRVANAYLVIDIPARRVVASHLYSDESSRDLAYKRAQQDTIERNEAEAIKPGVYTHA